MNTKEQAHFDKLYRLHLRTLKPRGMSDNTIDSYARAVRRVSEHFDCSPERLTLVRIIMIVNTHYYHREHLLQRFRVFIFILNIKHSDFLLGKLLPSP